jgi:prolipoprotein diacylglyceryltransferase
MLGAQLLAYLVDRHASVVPPANVSSLRYFFDPLYGPKTLYGAIIVLPLTGLTLRQPRSGATYAAALDCWTPPLLAVVGMARIGCFLEGCCFGVPTSHFGVTFPAGSPAAVRQAAEGLIQPGGAPLPVVPTQLIEAMALFGLCLLALQALRAGRQGIFLPAVAAYSLVRFGLEFVRDDPERNALGPLAVSQWIAVAVLTGYAFSLRAVRIQGS